MSQEPDPNSQDQNDAANPSSMSGAGLYYALGPLDDKSTYLGIKQRIYSNLYGFASGVENATEHAVERLTHAADGVGTDISRTARQFGFKIAPARLGEAVHNAGMHLVRAEDSLRVYAGHLDMQAMMDTLHRNTHFDLGTGDPKVVTVPKKWCARAVRLAWQAGGVIFSGHLNDARDYINYLSNRPDFHQVASGYGMNTGSYKPEMGDICVWSKNHITMYDGRRWVSDFEQRDMAGGPEFRNGDQFHVFRYNGMQASPTMAANAPTHKKPSTKMAMGNHLKPGLLPRPSPFRTSNT
ncbi:MAG TPA: hypothetical protein VMV79_00430 [Alphaproteobacteria bacterium]|nr:hypothetical protein [Alphaproteobacteria bacterium]